MTGEWILNLTEELQLPHAPPDQELYTKSIYRVPKILTDLNSQAYEPKLASFGPYHHFCSHLRPMEQHKHRALIQFLRRLAKSSKTPEDVLIAMRKVEPRLLASYDNFDKDGNHSSGFFHRYPFPRWNQYGDRLLELMTVDGCFALEVMLAEKRSAAGEQSEYDSHDPIFGVEGKNHVLAELKRDMLLLENQIPLLALTTLAAIDGSGIEDVSTLIKSFYNLSSSTSNDLISVHILDLYRTVLTAEGEYLPSYEENEQSATELRNAGVSFCKSNTKSFRNISFNGGVLSLPPLEIDDTTESLLLNLMAFERLHATAGNEVTAYSFFMNGLINTADDVALLRTKEIIMGRVVCDGNIATMFNKITKEATRVVFKDDIIVDVNRNLNGYCKKRMHRWRASFVESYLRNPWVFTSLLGGLFLLALTVVQTVCSVLQLYDK